MCRQLVVFLARRISQWGHTHSSWKAIFVISLTIFFCLPSLPIPHTPQVHLIPIVILSLFPWHTPLVHLLTNNHCNLPASFTPPFLHWIIFITLKITPLLRCILRNGNFIPKCSYYLLREYVNVHNWLTYISIIFDRFVVFIKSYFLIN